MKLLPKIKREERRADAYRQLMRREAKMGGELFGPIPTGRRREFFCLDRYTWVWHEEWTDAQGRPQATTTRYDIRPQGVLKSQGNSSYQLVRGVELRNLHRAAELYYRNLTTQLAAMQTRS